MITTLICVWVATDRRDTMPEQQAMNDDDPDVLPNGGEIQFTDDRPDRSADRVEFLSGGWIKAVYKKQYKLEVYPPHIVEGVFSHTNHLEDEDWW